MQKIILFAGFFLFASMASHAQSIDNRNWNTYISNPINDTITLHIHSDSSFVTNSKGEVMIRTNCMISGDTLTLLDYAGEHECPDMKGKYRVALNDNNFILTLIDDPCDGRSQALNGTKWTESSKK